MSLAIHWWIIIRFAVSIDYVMVLFLESSLLNNLFGFCFLCSRCNHRSVLVIGALLTGTLEVCCVLACGAECCHPRFWSITKAWRISYSWQVKLVLYCSKDGEYWKMLPVYVGSITGLLSSKIMMWQTRQQELIIRRIEYFLKRLSWRKLPNRAVHYSGKIAILSSFRLVRDSIDNWLPSLLDLIW